MNSDDINKKIFVRLRQLEIESNLELIRNQALRNPKKFTQKICTNNVKNLKVALKEYTSEKLLGVERPESYVEDLGVMFDLLDGSFENFLDEADFYMGYIKCIIDMFNMHSPKKMTFSFMTDEEEKSNPSSFIKESPIADVLKMKKNTSVKEDVIYLINYLSNNYVEKNTYQKVK